MDPTPAKIRAVFGDALFGIRFPVMDPKQFSSRVVKSGVLTAEVLPHFSVRLHVV